MWSRKAECSCCCSFPRLSFNMKRKIRQVVERLPKQGWYALLKQNFNNFAYLTQGGLQEEGSLQVPPPALGFYSSHETILNLQRQRIRPLSKFPMLISFLAPGLSDCGLVQILSSHSYSHIKPISLVGSLQVSFRLRLVLPPTKHISMLSSMTVLLSQAEGRQPNCDFGPCKFFVLKIK